MYKLAKGPLGVISEPAHKLRMNELKKTTVSRHQFSSSSQTSKPMSSHVEMESHRIRGDLWVFSMPFSPKAQGPRLAPSGDAELEDPFWPSRNRKRPSGGSGQDVFEHGAHRRSPDHSGARPMVPEAQLRKHLLWEKTRRGRLRGKNSGLSHAIA